MPTGYTRAVQVGEITRFEDFAWQCARGMGALILMRDHPADAPVPERFEPSTAYYDRAIKAAQAKLDNLDAMSAAQVEAAALAAHIETVETWRRRRDERDEQRARYEAMLAKAEAWEPPTSEHVEFKKFMVDQLRESIDFDCRGRHDDESRALKPEEWRRAQVEEAARDLSRNTEARAEEIARTEGRNRWLADLRRSLAEVEGRA